MGRGNANFERALFEVSNGKMESIKAKNVTEEMKARRQVFYCPTPKCEAKLSHNKGRGKNPKPYFFLRKLPNGEKNTHAKGCKFYILDEYVDIEETVKIRNKYDGVKWEVPLEDGDYPQSNTNKSKTNVPTIQPSSNKNISYSRSIKPNIMRINNTRACLALRNELIHEEVEIRQKINQELKDQGILYNTYSYDKLLMDIKNKAYKKAFYVLGYLWVSEWKHFKNSENAHFLLRGADKKIAKCYFSKDDVQYAVSDLTWDIQKNIKRNAKAKRSAFVAVKAVVRGTEVLNINGKETEVASLTIYEIGTEDD
ncbi:hypothetical protein [Bacillus swezeyi]|uniref:hypothetical protein n=1 Tax=Bacillus swezeyi TaxID=1925020 RepID=UPI00123AB111|nr:hypothetical protein [Bacillus swezeyi]KAA6472218.1 hypothetical protein DX928_22605 [Bacillus swezeyi]